MRITNKDREVYKYISEQGFATVKHIANVFFNDITYKNELAKKRLTCLIEHGYVKQIKSVNCNQHIFYADDKFKKQTYHNIVLMDLYTKFLEMRGLEIINFEREKTWAGKVRSDGFLIVKYRGKIQSFLIEVQASNNSWKNSITKYEYREVVEEIRDACDGVMPVLIYVDELMHNITELEKVFQIRQVDMKLTDFPLIFDSE